MISEKLMKPAQYAEHQLLTAILGGEYPPGTELPGERKLSELIGVTRPTLRETLQKMAREGWLSIRHGKSTTVKDYMNDGGMGVLSTMARFVENIPMKFVEHFLVVRCVVLPPVSRMALEKQPHLLERYLEHSKTIEDNSESYTDYDWNLQLNMASYSGNPFFRIILNDFDFLYRKQGGEYFKIDEARALSRAYYEELLELVRQKDGEGVEKRVLRVMEDALELWKILTGGSNHVA
jgi:GntR family negative regulator for fad regulon and positive regulator of fabA